MELANREPVERIRAVLPDDTIGKNDLLPVFSDNDLFGDIVDVLAAPWLGKNVVVAAPESMGWIVGSAIAVHLKAGFIGIRKKGNLPYPDSSLLTVSFTDYSGTDKTLELSVSDRLKGSSVLLVDDWVETGVQMKAMTVLLQEAGAVIAGMACIGADENPRTLGWMH